MPIIAPFCGCIFGGFLYGAFRLDSLSSHSYPYLLLHVLPKRRFISLILTRLHRRQHLHRSRIAHKQPLARLRPSRPPGSRPSVSMGAERKGSPCWYVTSCFFHIWCDVMILRTLLLSSTRCRLSTTVYMSLRTRTRTRKDVPLVPMYTIYTIYTIYPLSAFLTLLKAMANQHSTGVMGGYEDPEADAAEAPPPRR